MERKYPAPISLKSPYESRPMLSFRMPLFPSQIAILPFLFGGFVSPTFAQLGAPELHALQQLGCKVGQSLQPISNATGQALAGTASVLTSQGLVHDNVPLSLEPGIYQVRAVGPNGLSNSRNFMVTLEPWVLVVGNESEVNPAAIAPETIWQDECPERGRNYYRMKFDEDQKLELQSFAYSLDSRARLVLSLLTADHRTVATSSATNDRDAVLSMQLKANTEYTLVVHDHLFRGGPEYRYALRLSNRNASKENDMNIVDRWRVLAKQHRNGFEKNLVTTNTWHPRCAMLRSPSEAPLVVHDETLNSGTRSMPVTWPVIVTGEWNSNEDVDMFEFECDAKQDVSIEMVSQRLGELSDGAIVAYRVENPGQANETLHRIVENDDGPNVGNTEVRFTIKDPIFTFQSPEKGTYRLHVRTEQRLDRFSDFPKYAIEIRKPNPGFVLGAHFATPTIAVDQTRITCPTIYAGGSIMISIHALRFDSFNEPIELGVSGLPDGFRGGSGVVARDQNLATLNVWNYGAIETPERKDIETLEIKGSVEIGSQSISALAMPLEVTWNAIDTFRAPIAKIAQSLILGRGNSVQCPLTIELGPKDLDARSPVRMDVIRGQPLKIPVRVSRRSGGEGVITVRLHHSPPKTTAAEIKIEPNAIEGVLDLQIPKDAPLGEFLLGALCESTVSIPNTDPLAKEKTKSIPMQLPSSNVRVRIGDAP